MRSQKVLVVMNVSLGLIAVLLLLNLFDIGLPAVGKAQYNLIDGEPFCAIFFEDEVNEFVDLDHCCLGARQQLSCDEQYSLVDGNQLQWSCGTGEGVQYLLNKKAYKYCQLQPIWD